MKSLAILSALSVLLISGLARAEGDYWDGDYDVKSERRSGFAASIGLSFGVGMALGYPNEADKIDDARYESSVDSSFAGGNTIWLGGALRDWFTVGLGITGFGARQGDLEVQGGGYIIHLEGFPLWSLGGAGRDLAAFANFGAGTLTIKGGPEKADGGLLSVLGFGTSYELFRFGHFALGPTLEGTYLYSQSAEGGGVLAGFRAVFYGGP